MSIAVMRLHNLGELEMKVTAYNENGARLCEWDVNSEAKLAAQMFADDLKAIDGYAIPGHGIFRCQRVNGKLTGFSFLRNGAFDSVSSKQELIAVIGSSADSYNRGLALRVRDGKL